MIMLQFYVVVSDVIFTLDTVASDIYMVSWKKLATFIFMINLANVDQFEQFCQCCIQQ